MEYPNGGTNLVSIHAPREGCDAVLTALTASAPSFNSRTPGGVRRHLVTMFIIPVTFQFTHPGRGATSERSLDVIL